MRRRLYQNEEDNNDDKLRLLRAGAIAVLLFILSTILVFAGGDNSEAADAGKILVKSKVVCGQLEDSQLESIGEYYMELMHPGELHNIMDMRMGGEGSENLRLAHINIGKSSYCGEFLGMPGYGYVIGSMGDGMIGPGGGCGTVYAPPWIGNAVDVKYRDRMRTWLFEWMAGVLVFSVLVFAAIWSYKRIISKT